jgi:hypothetical protein
MQPDGQFPFEKMMHLQPRVGKPILAFAERPADHYRKTPAAGMQFSCAF